MKKVFINPSGKVISKEVNPPYLKTQGSIVKTSYALISTGTELSKIISTRNSNLPLFKRVLRSKSFRKRAISEIRKRKVRDIIKIFIRLFRKKNYKNISKSTMKMPSLGYCCSGSVEKTNISSQNVNDIVACAGSNHAELIFSPKNLTCRVPENVSLEEASFTTLGAIALQGVHRAKINQGENVGVIGTGLIGLIVVQLVKLCGAKVFAFDLLNKRLNIAKKLGADILINPKYHNIINKINDLTDSQGLDSIIVCASSKSSAPLDDAVDLIRDKGRIVLLGLFPIIVNREKLYLKEADLLISRSYGAGRYDQFYEYEGNDYPKEYVPWTVKRNMKFILKMISEKKLNVKSLISEIISADNISQAYQKLEKDPVNNIAVLINFSNIKNPSIIKSQISTRKDSKSIKIGLIGCGKFAQSAHLPHLISNTNCKIKAICTQSKNSAEICKNKYNPEYITTNYKKILKDNEIDAVFIYTRHDTHAKFSIEALENQKNVYVEKPMGLNLKECLKVNQVVQDTGLHYLIGFNRRYSPFIKITRDLIQKRKNPIILNIRVANQFIPGEHWIFDPKVGGGPLIGEMCHFTDLILFLINSKPLKVNANGGSMSHKNIPTFDSCVAMIEFKNGSIANLIYTDLNGTNMPKERIEIYSGESSIIIEDFLNMKVSGFDYGNLLLSSQDKGHKNEISEIINVLTGKQEPIVNSNDAIKAMKLCFAIIESIKNKNIIFLNDE